MQTLLLPAARSGVAPPTPRCTAAVSRTLPSDNARSFIRFSSTPDPHSSLSSFKLPTTLALSYLIVSNRSRRTLASPPIAAAFSSPTDESEKAKLAQVSLSLSVSLSVCCICVCLVNECNLDVDGDYDFRESAFLRL